MSKHRAGTRSQKRLTKNSKATWLRNRRFGPASSWDQLIVYGLTALICLSVGVVADRVMVWTQIGQPKTFPWFPDPISASATLLPNLSNPPSATPLVRPGLAPSGTPNAPLRYTIQPGDTLLGLASRFHVSVQSIRDANYLTSDSIVAGSTLLIPSAGSDSR